MNTLLTLKEIRCCDCAMLFAMTDEFYQHRLANGRMFYCPAGHAQHFTARDDELAALKREKQSLQSQLTYAVTDAERQKREKINLKGQLTKTRNRIANGVCPCCNRTFQNVARHIAGQHPDFKTAVTE